MPKPITELVSGPITIDPANPEVLELLSLTCLRCGPIAHVLQRAGYDIARRAENEQGAVLLWLLSMLRDHGPVWREKADLTLNEMNAAARAATTAEHGNG